MSEIKKPPKYDSVNEVFENMGVPVHHVPPHAIHDGTQDDEAIEYFARESTRSFQSRWSLSTLKIKRKEAKIKKIETKIMEKIETPKIARESDLNETTALIRKRDRLQKEIKELKCKKKK